MKFDDAISQIIRGARGLAEIQPIEFGTHDPLLLTQCLSTSLRVWETIQQQNQHERMAAAGLGVQSRTAMDVQVRSAAPQETENDAP